MNVKMPPRHAGFTSYQDDRLITVDGAHIGGTYYASADAPRRRWASWGPAGLLQGFPTRSAAAAAQVSA